MSRGEGVTAARFEIALKGLCLCECFKCNVGLDFPWEKLGGMRNLAGIMFCEAGAEIGSTADVALAGIRETAENVGVVHGELLLGVSVTSLCYRTRFSLLFAFVA